MPQEGKSTSAFEMEVLPFLVDDFLPFRFKLSLFFRNLFGFLLDITPRKTNMEPEDEPWKKSFLLEIT